MSKVQRMATQRQVIKSTEDVIKAFGGPAALAKRWQIERQNITQWRRFGVPTGWHCRFEHALNEAGYIVDVRRLGWV